VAVKYGRLHAAIHLEQLVPTGFVDHHAVLFTVSLAYTMALLDRYISVGAHM
jgi:hypothetical protein